MVAPGGVDCVVMMPGCVAQRSYLPCDLSGYTLLPDVCQSAIYALLLLYMTAFQDDPNDQFAGLTLLPTTGQSITLGPDAAGLYHCGQCVAPEGFSSPLKAAVTTHAGWKHTTPEKLLRRKERLSASQMGSRGSKVSAAQSKPIAGPFQSAELQRVANALPISAQRALQSNLASHRRKGIAPMDEWEARQLRKLRAAHPELSGSTALVPQPADKALTREREKAALEAAARREADELFERVASAADVLYPRGVPTLKVIEVAQWMVDTIQMVRR